MKGVCLMLNRPPIKKKEDGSASEMMSRFWYSVVHTGGIIGKSSKAKFEAICQTSKAKLQSPLQIAKHPEKFRHFHGIGLHCLRLQ
ncbi:hypothetical protein TorRG33x02_304640 [Trema orientale]|uniref:Uncharacterized protein n=1 Tax=Trema orientale TaxID=63057 RepID=A0A2P5BY19_TREOI|nr:hypothetical protein TorRG33x02_304640 [Trema orientale]